MSRPKSTTTVFGDIEVAKRMMTDYARQFIRSSELFFIAVLAGAPAWVATCAGFYSLKSAFQWFLAWHDKRVGIKLLGVEECGR